MAKSRNGTLTSLSTLLCLCFFFLLGPQRMSPGRPPFAIFASWIVGLFGGRAMSAVGQPPFLGMLIAGIVLRNAPGMIGLPPLVDGLPSSWGLPVRIFGLAVILMRSGLEADFKALHRSGPACQRLTGCPGCMEAIVVGLASHVLFGMPISLAFSLGCILAVSSPAVVVGCMFDLQRRGYGVNKAIPSFIVVATSLDHLVALAGFGFCISFGTSDEHSSMLSNALRGPLNIIIGVALGVIGGSFASRNGAEKTTFERSMILALTGLVMAYGCSSFNFIIAGAMASFTTAWVASRRWLTMDASKKQHTTATLSDDLINDECEDDPAQWPDSVGRDLAAVWTYAAQPLLFAVSGSALNFAELEPYTIPATMIIIVCGLVVRSSVAFLVCPGFFTTKERAFVALTWIPKGTFTAAFGIIPLDIVHATIDPQKEPQLYAMYEQWSLQIVAVAVMSIILTVPAGFMFIQHFGRRWLTWDR